MKDVTLKTLKVGIEIDGILRDEVSNALGIYNYNIRKTNEPFIFIDEMKDCEIINNFKAVSSLDVADFYDHSSQIYKEGAANRSSRDGVLDILLHGAEVHLFSSNHSLCEASAFKSLTEEFLRLNGIKYTSITFNDSTIFPEVDIAVCSSLNLLSKFDANSTDLIVVSNPWNHAGWEGCRVSNLEAVQSMVEDLFAVGRSTCEFCSCSRFDACTVPLIRGLI